MNNLGIIVSSQLLPKVSSEYPDNMHSNNISDAINNKICFMDDSITIDVQENNLEALGIPINNIEIVGDGILDGLVDNGVDEDQSKLTYSYRFKHHRTISDSVRLLSTNCCNVSEEGTSARREDRAREFVGPLLLKSQSYHSENINSKTTAIKKGNINHNTCGFQNITETDSNFGAKNSIKAISLSTNVDGDDLPNCCYSNHFSNETVKSSSASSMNSATIGATFSPFNNKRRSKFNIVRGSRSTIFGSIKNMLIRSSLLTYIIPVLVLSALIFLAYFTRDYTKKLLFWIETQNYWIIFIVYILLFIAVSFPIIVGYLVLIVTAGYLLGTARGLLTVILGANIGIAIVHITIKNIRYRLPLQR